jgi:hypothetical protein
MKSAMTGNTINKSSSTLEHPDLEEKEEVIDATN